jgi:uncharacterized protein YbjT (DUF2867 family)
MKIVVVGGHGQIALLLPKTLPGHEVISLVRKESQFADIEAAGGIPSLFDIANDSAEALAALITGADAVVFSAGAGAGSTPAQQQAIDLGGALKLADAAELAGVSRYVIVSSIGADSFDPSSDDGFQLYLRAKSEADANIRARDLDWTIIRPATLASSAATGGIEVGSGFRDGSIPRADVAAVIARTLVEPAGIRQQFDIRSGDQTIEAAALTATKG